MRSKKQRIPASILLLTLLFILAFSALQVSGAAAGGYHPPSEGILGPGEEEFTGGIIARGGDNTPEKEEEPFPWVWVGAGAGAVVLIGAVLLIRKKK